MGSKMAKDCGLCSQGTGHLGLAGTPGWDSWLGLSSRFSKVVFFLWILLVLEKRKGTVKSVSESPGR